jgi:dTDP-4-dehydrorhamnose reductase
MKNKVLISGGNGNLASQLVKHNTLHSITTLSRQEMDVTDIHQIESAILLNKPDYFIHTAALTRPMINHITSPTASIQSNIIGTSNVTLMCIKHNIKLIYISTDYIYPGTDGNYQETDPILPVNEYAWSKLGGECAVRLYKNSLILRMALCENPFPHNKALYDVQKSYIFIGDAAEIILQLKDEIGTINVGGVSQTPYEFAKKVDNSVGKIYHRDISDVTIAKDTSLNINKMNKLIQRNK